MAEQTIMLAVVAMAAAALPFVGAAAHCDELSRNVATCLVVLEDARAEDVAAEMLRHRMAHFGLRCGDVELCARVMGLAWRRSFAPQIELLEIA